MSCAGGSSSSVVRAAPAASPSDSPERLSQRRDRAPRRWRARPTEEMSASAASFRHKYIKAASTIRATLESSTPNCPTRSNTEIQRMLLTGLSGFVLVRLAAACTLASSGVKTRWRCCDATKKYLRKGAIFSLVRVSVIASPLRASSKRSRGSAPSTMLVHRRGGRGAGLPGPRIQRRESGPNNRPSGGRGAEAPVQRRGGGQGHQSEAGEAAGGTGSAEGGGVGGADPAETGGGAGLAVLNKRPRTRGGWCRRPVCAAGREGIGGGGHRRRRGEKGGHRLR